jgi:hypothetical protein
MSNVLKASTSVKKKTIYRVKNWAAYNQSLIARGSLTLWLDDSVVSRWYYEGPTQRGSQYTYSDGAIELGLTVRRLLHLPLRQTQGFVESLLVLMGLHALLDTPTYSTFSRRQRTLKVDLPVQPTEEPMHLVVDSTGLKVYGEGEWKARQHGASKRRTWRKLHLGINAESQEIVAQQMTEAYADDAHQLKPLLAQVETPVARCYGDGAYDRWHVHRLLAYPPAKQPTPIESVIPPCNHAQIKKSKRRYRHIEARNKRVQQIKKRGRKKWKQHSGYHRRSLVETAMARFKRIIGPQLQAREWNRQQVEVQIGCAILNRMTKLGMPQSYKVET